MRSWSPLVAFAALGVATIGFAPPSGAQASEGSGAFGYKASFTIFGGGPFVFEPAPTVTLPAGGSASPVVATAPSSRVAQGPGVLLTSGPIEVSTQGTTGPGGSVTSKTRMTTVPTSSVGEILYAGVIESTCTASASGATGSTTLAGPGDAGRAGPTIRTSDGNPDVEGDETYEEVPTNPPPNTTINGKLESVDDTFRVVLNEQIKNPDGSITVNAVHEYLLGPTAVGDLFIGQSRCSLAAAGSSGSSGGSPEAGSATTARPAGQTGSATTVAGRGVAKTGTNILRLLLPASALIVAGVAAVLVTRRRRVAQADDVSHGSP